MITMSNTATLAQPQTSTTTWNLDPAHTVAEFKVKHMMIANVKGHFSGVSGVLIRDESDPANDRVEATIEAASIETRNEQRDGHLKSADFFHVEKFPTLHFKSTGISVVGEGELSVEGDLTIRGVTRKVQFAVEGPTPPAKDPWGNTRIGLSASTRINRKDFGLTWNAALETGGILVGDEITITLDAQFVKA
jgi:polyisoprenoid-binding protein YceI